MTIGPLESTSSSSIYRDQVSETTSPGPLATPGGAGTVPPLKSQEAEGFSPSEEASELIAAHHENSRGPGEAASSTRGAQDAGNPSGFLGLQLRPPKVTDFTDNPEEHKNKMYVVGETSKFRHQMLCMPGIDRCVGFEPDKERTKPPPIPGMPVMDAPGKVATSDMPDSGIILKSIDATPEEQKKFWDTEVNSRVNGKAPDYHAKGNNCVDWVNGLFSKARTFLEGQ